MTLRFCITLLLASAVPALAATGSNLVVLQPTGQSQGGLPIVRRHPAPAAVQRVLTRGFSGRLLRLYALEQEYLRRHTGHSPEPAYLLLSKRQGGFPGFGFVLDGIVKPEAGFVDLHERSPLAGRFGAVDQIFPHELLHVITRQLAGEPGRSGSNQIHAVGVRTDPVIAFQEGFAEHAQIACVDDPDADPRSSALARDEDVARRSQREFDRYARGLASRTLIGRAGQIRFLLWFSSAEQVARYHAVKANLFARYAPLPADLEGRGDKYDAYLFQNVLPGPPDGEVKPGGVLLSTEGVVANLFWRWTTDEGLRQRYRDEAFYALFGVDASEVSPLENVYLKLFHALFVGRAADTGGLIRAYVAAFPDEEPMVARVVSAALLGQSPRPAPELWMANPGMTTGTSLFDQFRALPRPHTFDANAATALDWLGVSGVSADRARSLIRGAPYKDLEALRSAASDPGLQRRIGEMLVDMEALRTRANDEEQGLDLGAIVKSYMWRLLAYLASGAFVGTVLAKGAGGRSWWSAAVAGSAGTVLVFLFAWVIVSPPWMPVVAPAVAGGIPSSVWAVVVRRRTWATGARSLAAWAAAAAPALALSGIWQ